MPATNPIANPVIVSRFPHPNLPSSHHPATAGKIISKTTVVILETHSKAKAVGCRPFELLGPFEPIGPFELGTV